MHNAKISNLLYNLWRLVASWVFTVMGRQVSHFRLFTVILDYCQGILQPRYSKPQTHCKIFPLNQLLQYSAAKSTATSTSVQKTAFITWPQSC